jgi:hypothetical protein
MKDDWKILLLLVGVVLVLSPECRQGCQRVAKALISGAISWLILACLERLSLRVSALCGLIR